MKSAALVLSLFVTLAQSVSFTNCCQGTLCSQKDNCPACPESGAPGEDDCCGTGAPPRPGSSGCVHLEPSLEVDSGVTSDHDFLAAAWVEILSTDALAALPEIPEVVASAFEGGSPPESPPLLYLRNLSLLI